MQYNVKFSVSEVVFRRNDTSFWYSAILCFSSTHSSPRRITTQLQPLEAPNLEVLLPRHRWSNLQCSLGDILALAQNHKIAHWFGAKTTPSTNATGNTVKWCYNQPDSILPNLLSIYESKMTGFCRVWGGLSSFGLDLTLMLMKLVATSRLLIDPNAALETQPRRMGWFI